MTHHVPGRTAGHLADPLRFSLARRPRLRDDGGHAPDADRFRLLHGPYCAPRCRVGGFLTCRIRGRLKVAGISDTRIQWPYACKGRPCLIITATLARAIRRESATALCYWLGVPVVMSAEEVGRVLHRVTGAEGAFALMARLLYGCGLRLMECCRLRVKDVDFGRGQIMVRQGKGNKDRVVMLPRSLRGELAGCPHEILPKFSSRKRSLRVSFRSSRPGDALISRCRSGSACS